MIAPDKVIEYWKANPSTCEYTAGGDVDRLTEFLADDGDPFDKLVWVYCAWDQKAITEALALANGVEQFLGIMRESDA